MPRWHSPACHSADVFVETGIPQCRACGAAASSAQPTDAEAATSASIVIPPDESADQTNLSWPPCVRWTNTESPDDGSAQPNRDEAGLADQTAGLSAIYENTLDADSIRLICLHAGEFEEPIHLTLEEYRHVDCPDYETVSYTWQDESGDATRCMPVYVGPCWDVFHQTRNCWSLLRYLRPTRESRMVWIDAICINQANNLERGHQVARMGEIYRRCMRVVVWLGHDMVTQEARRSRPKYRLEEVADRTEDSQSLRKLFRRKYFTRVWVIQELILAPSSLFPIGDKDFFCVHGTIERIQLLAEGQEQDLRARFLTPPPKWLQHAHDANYVMKQDLFSAMQITLDDDIKSSDPRDSIFGILGLCQDSSESSSTSLVPDYSCSLRSMLIGTSAYLFLKLGRLEVLRHAACSGASTSYPSWVPDWRRAWYLAATLSSDSAEFCHAAANQIQLHSARWGRVHARMVWDKSVTCRSPLEDAFVESRSGSIRLNLIHIMKIPALAKVEWTKYLTIQHSRGAWKIIFVVEPFEGSWVGREDISRLLETDADLFFLGNAKSEVGVLLALRNISNSRRYNMISCWYCSGFALARSGQYEHFRHQLTPPERSETVVNHEIWGKVLDSLEGTKEESASDVLPNITFWQSLDDVLQDVHKILDAFFAPQQDLSCLKVEDRYLVENFRFQPSRPKMVLLFMLQELLAPESEWPAEQEAAFVEKIADLFGTACITTSTSGPNSLQFCWILPEKDSRSVRKAQVSQDHALKWTPFHNPHSAISQPSRYYCRAAEFIGLLRSTAVFDTFRRLSRFQSSTGESEVEMAMREPKVGDMLNYGAVWPEGAAEALELDGQPRRVTIA